MNSRLFKSWSFTRTMLWALVTVGTLLISGSAAADSITEWNERALACTATAKQAPYPATRALAMVHVAMFDAANSIEHRYSAYKVQVSARPGSSAEAAAIAAAHSVLIKLYADQSAELDAAYAASMARLPEDGKAGGVEVGEKVGSDIISLRENDGADAPNQYRPVTAPGVYVMTVLPVGSTWAGVKPWLMKSGSQFRPGAPPQLTSEIWARDYNEIKDVGGKRSTVRTAAQTEIGRFWAMVGPGSWEPIVRQLAATPGRTLLQNARLFALTEMAAADSYIAVFDAKYTYNFWRPITAIRNGDLGGNHQTDHVPDWEPLIDTPLHPEYPCAHCINSMAVATVLEPEFGSGPIPALTMTSSTAPGVVHKWSRIKEWTDEVAAARIYAGVHYRNSTVVGQDMGKKIGELAVSSYLRRTSGSVLGQAQSASAAAVVRAEVRSLKVTILSTMLANEGLGEWGFAALVEADGKKILYDTGARPNTVLENAKELGLDLSDVQDVVVSHFHDDHTAGLMTLRREFARKNPRAFSVVHVGRGFFRERRGAATNPMIAVKKEYEATGGVFIEHENPEEILPGVWLTGLVPRVFPEKNYRAGIEVATYTGWVEDNVQEDLSLVFNTSRGLVLLTGCGHAGLINTLQYARKFIRPAPVAAAIGGFHLFNATDEQLDWTADKLKEFQTAQILGAHCTGIESVYRLRQRMGLNRRTCSVGTVGATFDLTNGIQTGSIAR